MFIYKTNMIQKRNIYSTLAQGFTAAVSQPKTATNRQNMNILISADPSRTFLDSCECYDVS